MRGKRRYRSKARQKRMLGSAVFVKAAAGLSSHRSILQPMNI